MAKFKLDQKAAEAAREARNAYARQWRANNREKVKQYNFNYWAKKAATNGASAAAQGR